MTLGTRTPAIKEAATQTTGDLASHLFAAQYRLARVASGGTTTIAIDTSADLVWSYAKALVNRKRTEKESLEALEGKVRSLGARAIRPLIEALGETLDPVAAAQLENLLTDLTPAAPEIALTALQDRRVRVHARIDVARILSGLQQPLVLQAIRVLVRLMCDREVDEDVREGCVAALEAHVARVAVSRAMARVSVEEPTSAPGETARQILERTVPRRRS